ncbi:MAG TPA: tRNA pseudouridine(38-40) synthase TruA [Bryobacteraceae bacterium]|nr:tRNA pseudouridine(38-40) synthase TruA [Bryobacteraceae bacterium]
MKTWKLTIEYDGTKYSGWQEQRNARTVQGQIRAAAEEFFDGAVEIQGAGRTDAGVHARAQVAHLRVRRAKADDQRRWPTPEAILETLNSKLPSDVCLLDVAEAAPEFHARHDAIARTYVYQISLRRTAFFKKYVWWIRKPLDIEAMTHAAASLIGRHDFTAFRAADPSRPDESPIVVVEDAGIEREGDLLLFRITASHFVWRMVRRVLGALVKLGLGEITSEDFSRLLSGRADPKLDVASWTAPASGLFLERVTYLNEATRERSPKAGPAVREPRRPRRR